MTRQELELEPEEPGEDQPRITSVDMIRSMENPPDEAYEMTWRDALTLLEDAGPKAGFLLMAASVEGDEYKMKVALSSGTDGILISDLWYLLGSYLQEFG